MEGLRALDRYTVQFRLEQPRPRFIEVLADMAPDGLDQARHVGGVQEE